MGRTGKTIKSGLGSVLLKSQAKAKRASRAEKRERNAHVLDLEKKEAKVMCFSYSFYYTQQL